MITVNTAPPQPDAPPPPPQGTNNQQMLRLGAVLQLQNRALHAQGDVLTFLMLNETLLAAPYQQAALWLCDLDDAGRGKLTGLSGVANPDPASPYALWLKQVLPLIAQGEHQRQIHPVDPQTLPPTAQEDWPHWFPPCALWLPLQSRDGLLLGGLLLGRADPWNEGDASLLSLLGDVYAHSLALGRLKRPGLSWRERLRRHPRLRLAAAAALVLLAFMPVRQSVLAPAEVVPIEPALVRAPFDGLVDSFHVAPNAAVAAGQPLVSLDTTQLRTRLRVATKAREMAEAEYAQAAQQAMSDGKAKAKLVQLQSKVDQQVAEQTYVQTMLDRAELSAPIDGIAVFDDAAEWIGKPVAVGERILLVASPDRLELEIRVPVPEAITFDQGASVTFYPNIAPDHPHDGAISFASYGSAPAADGVLSYRFRAALTPSADKLRLGLKGTAKIYGPRRPLLLWLLRRPLGTLRQWLAL